MQANALDILKQQLRSVSISALVLRAGDPENTARALSASEAINDHIGLIDMVRNSGFSSAKVSPEDIKLIKELAGDPERLLRTIKNVIQIIAEGNAQAAFMYTAYMTAFTVLLSCMLRWSKGDHEAEQKTWRKYIIMVVRGVLEMFANAEIHEKLKKFKNSPAYTFMCKMWNKIVTFCKRVWAFVKSIFAGRVDVTSVVADDAAIKKFYGTCVSMAGFVYDVGKRTGIVKVQLVALPGLPHIKTSINSAVVADPEADADA